MLIKFIIGGAVILISSTFSNGHVDKAAAVMKSHPHASLDNFAAVEADPDAGAYAVIDILSRLPSIDRVMAVTWEARELSKRLTCR